ncbi:MAG TPA: DolP-mannose mannosyltransferase [Blastocatellia bacterium]|nr:DolP-mannose mannosyltransferase [Blastocatellia bacterium]
MPNETQIDDTTKENEPGLSRRFWLSRFGSKPALLVLVFVFAATVMLMYRPFSQMEGGDDAIWDYISQSIVRGQVPYRDVIENKAPGAGYLSALMIEVGKLAGVRDVPAIRAGYVCLAGLLCVLTYLVAEAYFHSRLAAILAFLVPLLSTDFAVMLISGTRPKLPMIVFGLCALLLIAKDKPFWAGFCSMLSCLCWQPGLLFTGTAVLIFSKYLLSWRDGRALKVLAGASVPLIVTVAYFYWVGALGELWKATIDYNVKVYMPEGNLGAAVAVARLWHLMKEVMGTSIIWVKLSALGFLVFGIKQVWSKLRGVDAFAAPELFKDALLIPPIVYLVFHVISYPGEDDLIPLFPFIGLFAAFLFLEAARFIAAVEVVRRKFPVVRFAECLLVVLIVVASVPVLRRAAAYRLEEGRTLAGQQRAFEAISNVLGPNDKIYVHGTLEILVLLNRPNLNPYILLSRGTDEYVSRKLPGGFADLLREMEAEAPKVISLSRLQQVLHKDELLQWAAERYDKLPLEFAHDSVYVRRVE